MAGAEPPATDGEAARTKRKRGRRLRGFTLPLTTALAFSLMSLAAGVVGLVVVGDQAAKAERRNLATLITLESAAETSLFALERDGAPVANDWTDQAAFNGQTVSVLVAPAKFKPDIDRDGAADYVAALADGDLRQRVLAATAPFPTPAPDANAAPAPEPSPDDSQSPINNAFSGASAFAPPPPQGMTKPSFIHFRDFLKAVSADPADEDCLRQRLTLGRRTGKPEPRLRDTALIPERAPLMPGEIIDLRASTPDNRGGQEILWLRVRFTGLIPRPWGVHEWRRMHLGPNARACPPPPEPDILSGATPPA